MKLLNLFLLSMLLCSGGCAWLRGPSDDGGRGAPAGSQEGTSGAYLGSPVGGDSDDERSFRPPAERGR